LTLQFYSHAVSQDRMAAAGEMLIAILGHAADQSGLKKNRAGRKFFTIIRLQQLPSGRLPNAD
jgi:hypothetical protein